MRKTHHKKRGLAVVGAVMIVMLALAASAFANQANSLQPAHVFYGQVTSGQHPVRMLTLKNRSGHTWKLSAFKVAGAGGSVFTAVSRDGCVVGLSLKSGESCQFGVRVKATRLGWFRSVLRVCYTENGEKSSGFFGSAELRAHVVAG
jgi:hypothetical protein